jgi:hypothetical protein
MTPASPIAPLAASVGTLASAVLPARSVTKAQAIVATEAPASNDSAAPWLYRLGLSRRDTEREH